MAEIGAAMTAQRSSLEQALKSILVNAQQPLPTDEIVQRASAELGGRTVVPEVVAFLLGFRNEEYCRDSDGYWRAATRAAVAVTTTSPSSSIDTAYSNARTPSEAYEHIKESVVSYLETQYKIAHPAVFNERGNILRQKGIVAQAPFIEATPAFPAGNKLVDLERLYPNQAPHGLSALVQHGVPVDRFPLYQHQQQALLAAVGDKPNLLVASGTGSGKTEAFLLPIFADILREAEHWTSPSGPSRPASYDEERQLWLHSRRHETRPAAVRAIVLYPMNALVNDQMSRLRRILARGTSPDWQRAHCNGNVIHFAMYTSDSQPTGSWVDGWRRRRFREYLQQVQADWNRLPDELRELGNWARPGSPEMLCRWDVQAAPPDILVTNYSMLEYMLVRPIESQVFDATRRWLTETPGARLTLVLDEAHTYTGAKGTEVAYLVRRLKERLGIDAGSEQFRAIATSASIPAEEGSEERLRQFTSDLFGEPGERFTVVHLASPPMLQERDPDQTRLDAFARFHETFQASDPWPAIDRLATSLGLPPPDRTIDPQVALHTSISSDTDVTWVRGRTARNATLIDRLADELWRGLSTAEERERATAGVLAAGSFARPAPTPDVPPLLSTRVHAFFRGIAGVWACMDPECPEVDVQYRSPERPVGRLYTDPRPWCSQSCGARVLELFSCRRCGLLFLGGIPDSTRHSLWPWSDDLNGERQDLGQYRIFGVERPHVDASPEYRSTRTTLGVHPNDVYARPVYEINDATDEERSDGNPFPTKCARCQNYRQPGALGSAREIIEPLRTRGPRSFSVVVEDGFRVQARAAGGALPNHGRKALLFSDSRQEAAKLAADLREDHGNDLFRQLVLRALLACNTCLGTSRSFGQSESAETCDSCAGSGRNIAPVPLGFHELRRRVIAMEFALGINPTQDEVSDFFMQLAEGRSSCQSDAELAFEVALRRELSEDTFALDPLGLASWRVCLPSELAPIAPLTMDETVAFVRAVVRVLATEDVLLPAPPRPPVWPETLVDEHSRNLLVWGDRRRPHAIPYNLTPYRKLGRFVRAIARALERDGRFPGRQDGPDRWVATLRRPLWDILVGKGILTEAGSPVADNMGYGLRVDQFDLAPVRGSVHRCRSCAQVSTESVLNICMRCGQETEEIDPARIRNFYRRAALYAAPDSREHDPYPLRSIEHTAQIPGIEARDLERWFQDLFRADEHPNDKRIDVLSVTTTMEMGIDIGSLLCVGLRNVPPTVANYQQRAGRAGRRGSAIATVLTYAQARSHDQYYFDRPPEIVSKPPRVPTLYLRNEVIAQRHVRSLLLQAFFHHRLQGGRTSGLFAGWGTIGAYVSGQTGIALRTYIAMHRERLIARCARVVHHDLVPNIPEWLDAIPTEVDDVVRRFDAADELFERLISSGMLPKYAFPVDVVSLAIPGETDSGQRRTRNEDDGMQRDLRIALAEYAPGAEVIRGRFPHTYLYRSAGVYDAFSSDPSYRPQGMLVECLQCQSVQLRGMDDAPVAQCFECGDFDVMEVPYLRPPGFTVDAAQRNGGGERYRGGGRERSGYVAPARLLIGETSFTAGKAQSAFAPRLFAHVRVGDLFACNKGKSTAFPGFLICEMCGRDLDPDNPGSHTYPADVPPHRGPNRGPRAGERCPKSSSFHNQVILGYRFHSEAILLGADLPMELDAPFRTPSGRAVWYSFGTLVANAAARVLQVDPGELQVGVRAAHRGTRLHGEVFLYDNVPGGAGYARAIADHLESILRKALELGRTCFNNECSGACYHCLYDYGNQSVHPLLDRDLGAALLAYLLEGGMPRVDESRVERTVVAFADFVRPTWDVQPGTTTGDHRFAIVLKDDTGQRIGLSVLHPLQSRPSAAERQAILARSGIRSAAHTLFDMERRPFWVANNLLAT